MARASMGLQRKHVELLMRMKHIPSMHLSNALPLSYREICVASIHVLWLGCPGWFMLLLVAICNQTYLLSSLQIQQSFSR